VCSPSSRFRYLPFPLLKISHSQEIRLPNDASLDWSDSGSGIPFDNVIINFDPMSPETLTLDLVIAHLFNEEVQQITAAPLLKEDNQIKMEHNEAMAVSCANTISEFLCFFCDTKGYYKSDCPE
jgi:hypothetical protein